MAFSPLLIVAAVIVPIAGGLLISLLPEKADKARNILAVAVTSVNAAIVLSILAEVLRGNVPAITLVSVSHGLDVTLRVDPLAAMFGTLAAVLWVFAALYSTGYMSHERNRRRYFTFYILSLGVTMGVAFAANLFTLYLFYEFLTIFTYPLVIHSGSPDAQVSGKRYITYSFIGAGLILAGIVMTYGNAGTLDFASGGIITLAASPASILQIAFVCFILGFGVKAALMPLHAWLPAAMVAPTPVSALLHAVAVVKSGVFGMLRIMYSVFGPDTMLALDLGLFVAIMTSVTIITASVIALRQDVLKKRLAYSTISQLSYIGLGGGLLTVFGLTGSILHMLNHALLKITLFFCAGMIITVTGKKKISEMAGIGTRMPVTMLAFAIGSIGMVGILPINGFISKMYLIKGSMDANLAVVIVILMTSALLNAAYFLPIVVTAFFREGSFERPKGLEAPASMLFPVAILAGLCVVLGMKPDLTIPFVERVVSSLFNLM